MKISDLTDILKKQFPEEEISNSSSDLGVGSFLQWDSLGHYNLLLLVEESYGIRFTIEEMSEMKSISDIAEVLALKGVKD